MLYPAFCTGFLLYILFVKVVERIHTSAADFVTGVLVQAQIGLEDCWRRWTLVWFVTAFPVLESCHYCVMFMSKRVEWRAGGKCRTWALGFSLSSRWLSHSIAAAFISCSHLFFFPPRHVPFNFLISFFKHFEAFSHLPLPFLFALMWR